MSRFVGCVSLALLVAAPVSAGELDEEYGAKGPIPPAIAADTLAGTLPAPPPADGRTAGELDAETPTQACGWRRGFGFGYGGFGYGGFGYGGFGYGGLGYGGLGGFGLGYGGLGGIGLRYSSFGLGYGGLGGFGLGYGGLGYGPGGFYGGFGGYPYLGYGGWGGWGCW